MRPPGPLDLLAHGKERKMEPEMGLEPMIIPIYEIGAVATEATQANYSGLRDRMSSRSKIADMRS